MNWKHDDLAEDLASHLRGSTDRMIWTDMQLGPSGSSRPDVYALPIAYGRFQPIAYECKVSMSDFRADVTKGKYTDYLKFAAGVVFACPAGLLKKDDIPAGAGLMVRGPDGWRSLKKATLVKCETLPREAWMKLLIDGSRRDIQRKEIEKESSCRSLNEYRTIQKIRAEFGEVVAAAIKDHRNQTTHHLADLKTRFATQTAMLAADLKRVEEKRKAARKQVDDHCSKLLTDLAAVVGMDPDAEQVYEMGCRLRDMIKLAQADTTVQELRSIIRSMKYGFDQFREAEAVLDAAAHGDQPRLVA
ncbi:hypothetical protein [Cupriavidus pauculus]|uniref:hypothetical protein n=1 Tax=Cupriavidus pauculus TaxID=82633 RepID=UPI0030F9F4C5